MTVTTDDIRRQRAVIETAYREAVDTIAQADRRLHHADKTLQEVRAGDRTEENLCIEADFEKLHQEYQDQRKKAVSDRRYYERVLESFDTVIDEMERRHD